MWSVQDMFYGEAEPVWILRPEKEDNKKADNRGELSRSSGGSSKKEAQNAAADDFTSSNIPYDPYYYPNYVPPRPTPYYANYVPPPPRPKKEETRADNRGELSRSSGGRGGGSSKKEVQNAAADDFTSSNIHYDPYYYPNYVPPPPTPKKEETRATTSDQKRDTKIVLKVPICCGECAESIEAALYSMRGVKSVECDTYREKVTVLATTGVSPADVLFECRKVFKKSRFWTDSDY